MSPSSNPIEIIYVSIPVPAFDYAHGKAEDIHLVIFQENGVVFGIFGKQDGVVSHLAEPLESSLVAQGNHNDVQIIRANLLIFYNSYFVRRVPKAPFGFVITTLRQAYDGTNR